MGPLPAAIKKSRCIVHIDLDCFYCQVEQVRLGISSDIPAAVQQWHSLIAVNYPARRAGVQRHSTVVEARKLCPEIRFMHVPTFAANDTEAQYYENPNRSTHKVSLDVYRNASREIFKIFRKYCNKIQKIGLDEGFIDMTEAVNQRLMEQYTNKIPELLDRLDDEECGLNLDWSKHGGVTCKSKEEEVAHTDTIDTDLSQSQNWSSATWADLQLYIGAEMAAEIRQEIFDRLGYTCSAGIAHYKVVAKLCSSKNKPNNQTVLREAARMAFMQDVPFNKIRNLGGKLGNEVVADLEIEKSSELWKYSIEELQTKFGSSTGHYLYNICRGIDHEEVNTTSTPKSLMAAKSFSPAIREMKEMEAWFSILSVELHGRINQYYEEYGLWPKSLSIRYASYNNRTYRSKGLGILHKDEMKIPENLRKKVESAFYALEDAMPCIGLDVVASGLSHDESIKSHTISQFFSKSSGLMFDDVNRKKSEQEQQQVSKQPAKDKYNNPKSGLLSYMKAPSLPSSLLEVGEHKTWVCDKCSKVILLSEVDEHTDYHFALDLQNQDRSQSGSSNSSNRSSPVQQHPNKSGKKRKNEQGDKDAKRLFFQSSSKPS